MTNLREKNRAVWNAGFPSHDFAWAVREWIAAATERMEPESEPAKVETTADRIAADIAAGTFRGAQPEPVAEEMPEEDLTFHINRLERMLNHNVIVGDAKESVFAAYMNAKMYGHAEEARLAIAAVRAQAAEAGKVRMPKVRSYFLSLSMLPEYRNDEGRAFLAEVKAELDAAEGKGEGRG